MSHSPGVRAYRAPASFEEILRIHRMWIDRATMTEIASEIGRSVSLVSIVVSGKHKSAAEVEKFHPELKTWPIPVDDPRRPPTRGRPPATQYQQVLELENQALRLELMDLQRKYQTALEQVLKLTGNEIVPQEPGHG